jgi:hypothetical protein
MSEYNKNKKRNLKDENISKLDPDNNIRWIIEETIKNSPFCGTTSLIEKLNDMDSEMSQILTSNYKKNEEISIKILELESLVNITFSELKRENELLKIHIKTLRDKIDLLTK